MSEYNSYVEVNHGSDRSFGIVFALVFLIIGLLPLLSSGQPRWWSLMVAGLFLLLAWWVPTSLAFPNRVWCKLGVLLGAFVAPIMMGIVFFLVVLPTGLLVRLFGKDLLHLKMDKQATSYWIKRDQPVGSMKNQF